MNDTVEFTLLIAQRCANLIECLTWKLLELTLLIAQRCANLIECLTWKLLEFTKKIVFQSMKLFVKIGYSMNVLCTLYWANLRVI